MTQTCYAGKTLRISAENVTLTALDGTKSKVTSGAVVTVEIENPDGTQLSSDTATATDDDWAILKTMPSTLGKYTVKITATKNGAVGEELDYVWVRSF